MCTKDERQKERQANQINRLDRNEMSRLVFLLPMISSMCAFGWWFGTHYLFVIAIMMMMICYFDCLIANSYFSFI